MDNQTLIRRSPDASVTASVRIEALAVGDSASERGESTLLSSGSPSRDAFLASERDVASDVWKCRLPSSGEMIAIVRSEAEAAQVAGLLAFSLAEVALAIEAFGAATLEAKRAFPGATVTAVRDRSRESTGRPAAKNQDAGQTPAIAKAKPPAPSGNYQSLAKKMPPDTRYKGESFPASNIEERYQEHMATQRAAAAVAEGDKR